MATPSKNPIHPVEILKEEFLRPMKVSQTELAQHLGWTIARVNELVNGKRGFTTEAALSIADALGTTPELWLNLQRNYDLDIALCKHKVRPLLDKAKIAA